VTTLGKTALVASAPSADFVRWAGGAIALRAEYGGAVTVPCAAGDEHGG
jgi:hypothetical protein